MHILEVNCVSFGANVKGSCRGWCHFFFCFPALSLLFIRRGGRHMKWGKQSEVLWVRPGGKKDKHVRTFRARAGFFMNGSFFFSNFPSLSFLWMKNNWKIQYKSPQSAGIRLAAAAQAPPTVARTPTTRLLIGSCGGSETSFISQCIHADKGKKFEPLKEEIHQSRTSSGPS